MFLKVHCIVCGKEFRPQELNQEFYLCSECSTFWLSDYLRRLKARIVGWWERDKPGQSPK